ncbi:Fe-S cluster assembly protein SufD [Planktothricoides raciborskii]|uniref:Fe-S cluster assembly protein SufD n=1 Tax=Planktothricoides raciborskii GIHE-MW2 TaxID=2792601 RepID=A0AAU8JCA1_9CYAN
MTMQIATKSEISAIARLLSEAINGATPTDAWLQQLRDNAAAVVRELGMPTTRDENWRFTNLAPLAAVPFQRAAAFELPLGTLGNLIDNIKILSKVDRRLVFVNGRYSQELSAVAGLPQGLFIGNLAQLPAELRDRLPEYLANQEGTQEVFTALNTAGLNDAAVIWLGKNVAVETPIHLLFISVTRETPALIQPRTLVVAEPGSAATVIEEYIVADREWCATAETQPYFTNTVTEIYLGQNAEVNHTRIQREAANSFHIGKSAIAQAKDSRYSCIEVNTGSKISRHNLEIYQKGEGTQTTLNGLTVIGGEQLADTHSNVVLNHPHGMVAQLQKCIVEDRAHSVFNGRVFVAKAAQLTDASQLNRNLILSRKGRVDTKPQLEIIADDVKCTHGATVSQLEAEEMFYLQSRGLDPVTSRNLLIDGFAGEILEKLPVPSLANRLSRCLACLTSH